MNNLKVFNNIQFGKLTVIIKNNKPYLEAISVATILGYSNPRDAIIRHCKKEGVVFHDVGVVSGHRLDNSEVIQYVSKKFIDEGNVYRLILKSKLPNAAKFEEWVMDEVLPSIRQHGAYMNEDIINKTLEDPNFIIKLATKLKEEKEKRIISEEKVEKLESHIIKNNHYTNFGKKISCTEDTITIGEFAKVLNNNYINIGRNRLYEILRDDGYLIKTGKEKNKPKQKYIEQGLFKLKECFVNTRDGEVLTTKTLITGKGQKYFEKRVSDMKYFADTLLKRSEFFRYN